MPKKTYLCIEDGEKFTLEADSIDEAREECVYWNAEVIGIVKNGKVEIV